MAAPVTRALASGALAVSFLTIVPVRARSAWSGELGPAAAWFPAVGAAVGLAAGGVRAGMDPLVGAVPATVLALFAGVVLTGALHQDGLADCADGLGVRGDLARRLEVMRDPAVGAFGVLALLAWALLVTTSVGSLSTGRAVIAFTIAGTLGRLAAVVHALACRPARTDGLSASFTPTRVVGGVAGVSAALSSVALAWPIAGMVALAVGAAACASSVFLARWRFGGRTGDTLGAAVCITEAAVCVALLGVWRP